MVAKKAFAAPIFVLILIAGGCWTVPDTSEAEKVVSQVYDARARQSGLAEIKFWPFETVQEKQQYLAYINERSRRSGKLVKASRISAGVTQLADSHRKLFGEFIRLVYRAEYDNVLMEELFLLKDDGSGSLRIYASEVLGTATPN